jgi:hypothetical protein
MQQQGQVRENPIKELTQAIGYFLAGGFLIGTVVTSQSAQVNIEPIGWFTIAVGSILIIAGFILTLSLLPFKRIAESPKFNRFIEFSRKWIFPILFAVATTQVLVMLVVFRTIQPLFIISIIFLVLVIVVIIATSKVVFLQIPSLLNLSLSFIGLASILAYLEADKRQIIAILVFSAITLSMTLWKYHRQRNIGQGNGQLNQ